MDNFLRVLVIDDDPAACDLVARRLCQEFPAAQVEQITEAQDLAQALKAGRPSLVIANDHLGQTNNLTTLRTIKTRWPNCPVILFADSVSQEIAREAIQASLDGYIPKSPQNLACLMVATWSALVQAQHRQAIQETEIRYRDLFTSVPVGLYRITPEAQILNANPALVRLLGYPDLASLLALNVADVVVEPQDLRRWQAQLENRGLSHNFKFTMRRRDGTTIWVEDNGRAVRDSGGRVRYYTGSLVDVTERVQAEEENRLLNQFRESVIDNASVWLTVLDLETIVSLWNKAAEEISGYSRQEAIGNPEIWDWHFPDETYRIDVYNEVMAVLDQGQELRDYEVTIRCKDGQDKVISWNARALVDKHGTPHGTIALGHDITERVRAEQALRESEERFRSVVETASDAIISTDSHGNVVSWNRAAEMIFGYTAGEIIGQPLAGIVYQDELQKALEMSQTGDSEAIETMGLRKDGDKFPVALSLAAWQEKGEVFFTSIIRDITAQVRTQQEITQRNQELVVLNEISQAITASLDLQETLTLITDHTTQLLNVAATSVFLCDQDHKVLRFMAGSSTDAAFVVGKELPMGQGIAGWVAQHGEPVLVTDTSQDPRWFKGFDQGSRFTAHSILCVPLQIMGQVIGVLQAINKRKGDFDLVDLGFLSALAAPAATAIEHARLFKQVQAAHEQLQALSYRLVEVQETERRNISREIHDESGQILSALLLGLSLLEREAAQPEAVVVRVDELAGMVEEMLASLHRLAVNLRPASLDHLGLKVALEQYLETFREGFGRQHGISVQLEMLGLGDERLPPPVETAFYRIVQEALTNVVRHAQATRVDVLLERRGDQVVTVIKDNGVGFDPQAALESGRLGLFGMRERAEMLNGTLTVESVIGAGTTVLAQVPWEENLERG
jgi:PAS domain S-box-containing protein